MSARNVGRILGVAVATAWALSGPVDTRYASAGPCPDVEVVFVRGTTEPPGVGFTGQAFVDSLTSKVPGRSVGVCAFPTT
jgi:cutinase